MRAAIALQVAQFRRARTIRLATWLIVLAPALFSVGFVALARTVALEGPGTESFAPYREGPFAVAASQLAGQMVSIWTLIAAGFAISWSVGREWSDGTYGSLFSLPVRRSQVAWAKVIVTGSWGAAAVTLTLVLLIAGLAVADAAHLQQAVWQQLARVWVAGLLTLALALAFGAVAAWSRGYLGAVAAIIAVTAVSQILASLGIGEWVPFVVPALWAGAAGQEAAAGVGLPSLLGALGTAAVGVLALVRAFARGHLD
jgi:ABC-2 type transport system permease protein